MITMDAIWTDSLLVEDFTAAFYSAAVGAQLMGRRTLQRGFRPGELTGFGSDVRLCTAVCHSENSDDWHWSAGGGLWFAPLVRTNAFSVTVAASPEEVLFYIRHGFHF